MTATTLESHPLADLIPAMSDDEYRELRADIEANGLREPVTLYEGLVLDGRHRVRACEELAIAPATREYDGDDPARYVISLNVHRRHLSTSQRATIAVEALPHFKVEGERRWLEGSASGGASQGAGQNTRAFHFRARDAAAAEVGKLRKQPPTGLIGDAKLLMSIRPITKTRAVAQLIVDNYNKGRTSGALAPL